MHAPLPPPFLLCSVTGLRIALPISTLIGLCVSSSLLFTMLASEQTAATALVAAPFIKGETRDPTTSNPYFQHILTVIPPHTSPYPTRDPTLPLYDNRPCHAQVMPMPSML